MTEKIFVTGVNGFVGKHLVNHLHSQDIEVVGVGREDVANPEIMDLLSRYYVCELTDQSAVNNVPWHEAKAVISLAGLAKVGSSFGNSEIYTTINVGVLETILTTIMKNGLKTRVVAISTGALYDPNQAMPLTEKSRVNGENSPYANSKLLMEHMADGFIKAGVDCVIARPLNHVGPGQEPGFLTPDLYKKIIESLVSGEPVKVGNLSTKRDYTDVRDVVKAYALLALAKSSTLSSSLYNICSGVSHSGNELYDKLKANIQGSENLETVIDEALIRTNDPEELVGDFSLLNKDTGWRPTISFDQTIADFVQSH